MKHNPRHLILFTEDSARIAASARLMAVIAYRESRFGTNVRGGRTNDEREDTRHSSDGQPRKEELR